MESPDVYILAQVNWEFFATLTFKVAKLPARVRYNMLFQWLRSTAASGCVYFPEMLWAVRAELGEQTERFHFHALLGATGLKPVLYSCHNIRKRWSGLEGSAGMARVTVFDPRRDAGSYLTKPELFETTSRRGLRLEGETRVGGDIHESAKFGASTVDELTISKSVYRLIAAKRGVDFVG
ncbi:MAG: hypothetical protein ACFUZC_07245 [Chthoniobacteraceae bacterium]